MVLFVYVDNSNLWIEGMRVSAVKKGLVKNAWEAMRDKVVDQSWTYDFGKLYEAICPDTAQIGRSSLFGSRPPENDSIWELARSSGFEVTLFDRNKQNKEKEVDVAIATQIVADSYEYMKPERGDRLVLVSGDRDYVPPIKQLAARGLPASVVFWDHATAKDLREAAYDFTPLDPLFEHLSR